MFRLHQLIDLMQKMYDRMNLIQTDGLSSYFVELVLICVLKRTMQRAIVEIYNYLLEFVF